MRVWIGRSILAVAAIHTVFGIAVLGGRLAPLLHRGLFNTVTLSQASATAATFWFFVSGVLAFLVGGLVHHLERLGIAFPGFLPWTLLALTIAGCVLMPVSAWWLLLVPVAGMFARRRRAVVVLTKRYARARGRPRPRSARVIDRRRAGMSPNTTDHMAPEKVARIAGGFYLAFILASVLADALGHVGLGSAPQVYQAIAANVWSFRLGLVIAFTSAFLFLMAAWGLYVLLRPVNRDLALLFLLLNTVGVAIQCASMLPLISAMLLGDGVGRVRAFSGAQLEGLAYLFINVYKTGFVTAQLFFGTWLFPLGYLVYTSKFLPRFLGVLLMLDGIAVLIWFLQALLLPAYPVITYPGLAVSFVAEVGLALWLLVRGVKVSDATAGSVG